jgi:hypothetical protein
LQSERQKQLVGLKLGTRPLDRSMNDIGIRKVHEHGDKVGKSLMKGGDIRMGR